MQGRYLARVIAGVFLAGIMAGTGQPALAQDAQESVARSVPQTANQSETGALTGDAKKGRREYKRRCRRCHPVGASAEELKKFAEAAAVDPAATLGPDMQGIYDRRAGTVETYDHSGIYVRAGKQGLHWTDEFLMKYLADPKGFLATYTGDSSAESKMIYKVEPEGHRRNLIAYLKTLK